MRTTLFVPTLNEIEGMKAIMPRVLPGWFDQILIMDGKSTDGTVEYARAQGYDVVIQSEPGLRKGYREAWPHIRGDVVVTFSPDGNSVPELLPELLEKMKEGYDMVIVSRYARGAVSLDDDFMTRFGNWTYNRLINMIYGAKYTDVMVIYRAYRTQLAYELGLDAAQRGGMELLGAGSGAGGNVDMNTGNFQETIIGEATRQAVDEITRQLVAQVESFNFTIIEINGIVADVVDNILILNVGLNHGVKEGDSLSIERILREIKDPSTGEVIRVLTKAIGTAQVTSADERSSIAEFSGIGQPQVGDAVKSQ